MAMETLSSSCASKKGYVLACAAGGGLKGLSPVNARTAKAEARMAKKSGIRCFLTTPRLSGTGPVFTTAEERHPMLVNRPLLREPRIHGYERLSRWGGTRD